MTGSQEVVIKLTEEQREQISKVTAKNISSVLLIEMCYGEPGPIWEDSQSGQTQLTTISST
jgi:hypothetical protein